jgi:uroporphyrinogen decarboxylase
MRPFLPDFIGMGMDIINPVHINAAGMAPAQLKADLGSRITFWGGSLDAQNVFPYGSPKKVKEDVKRNLEALMSGGGYVFASIHNIQADVPPRNIMAMWQVLQEYGRY